MKNSNYISTLLMGMLVLLQMPAASAALISFDPSNQTVGTGDSVNVDLVISGLDDKVPNDIVSAFDLDVSYDPDVLRATGVAFGAFLGDPNLSEAIADFDLSMLGRVDLAELSLLSDLDLGNRQPASFILATLSFQALELGTSLLSLEPDPRLGIDVKGLEAKILPVDVKDGNIAVVPLPGVAWLFGSALIGLLGFRSTGRQITV